MKVRATKRHRSEVAEHLRCLFQDPARVTIGSVYDVHAIVFYNWVWYFQPHHPVQMPGSAELQLIDDLGYPSWYPSVLFEVVDGKLPSDWKCNVFPHNDMQGPVMVIGPDFLVQNEAAYTAMVELEADQVDRFWKRVDSLLLPLESEVLALLLSGDHPVLAILRSQLSTATVSSREFTSAGFHTEFEVAPDAGLLERRDRFAFGDVFGRSGATGAEVGFVLFINDGRLKMLEGCAFDDDWPDMSRYTLSYQNGSRDWDLLNQTLSAE